VPHKALANVHRPSNLVRRYPPGPLALIPKTPAQFAPPMISPVHPIAPPPARALAVHSVAEATRRPNGHIQTPYRHCATFPSQRPGVPTHDRELRSIEHDHLSADALGLRRVVAPSSCFSTLRVCNFRLFDLLEEPRLQQNEHPIKLVS